MADGKDTAHMTPQPMETAPKDGGWVLGLVQPDGPTESSWQPWDFVTWGDGGWYDNVGDPVVPTAWVPIPDPQPRNTGWQPPEGHIRVVELDGRWTDGEGNPINLSWRWMVDIEQPDGSHDKYRDSDFRDTKGQAAEAAAKWAAEYGLPIVVVPLSAQSSNDVSISAAKLPASKEGEEHG